MSRLPSELRTRRLLLRRFEARDIAAVCRGLRDWNVAKWLGRVPHPYVPRHAKSWLARTEPEWNAGRDYTLAIVKRGGPDHVIGAVGIHNLHGHEQPCGYWLARKHWGKGYVSEAFGALLEAVFACNPNAHPVATALPENKSSIRVLQKAGFKRQPRQLMLPNVARHRRMRVLYFTYAGRGAVTAEPRPTGITS
jgi:RimJ/RimL family protein N-acetyltransferase